MANKGNVKSLRKDSDELKKQLQEVTKDFENLKSGKMAEQRRNQASPVAQPNEQNMQLLSDQYDDLLKSGTSLEEAVDKLSRKLDLLAKDVDRIDKAINDILSYSYQYNLKQARGLWGFGGFGRTPPTSWKGPLGCLLTNNLTELKHVSHV